MNTLCQLTFPKNDLGIVTPLRYPGGKSSISGLMRTLINESPSGIKMYVEPYAGGAGAAIALLLNGIVEQIVINDYDPAVYCFWRAIKDSNEKFCQKIEDTPLSIDEWLKQRSIYRQKEVSCWFELGFAFFYLNRCNRSGIVKGGVIGGYNQSGKYKLDARFNKERLIKKIKDIGKFVECITILNEDGLAVFEQFSKTKDALIYLDPPYVTQGGSLYLSAFNKQDHIDLAKFAKNNNQSNWIITYDNTELIKSNECYGDSNIFTYKLNYSVQHKRQEQELLICSEKLKPSIERFLAES